MIELEEAGKCWTMEIGEEYAMIDQVRIVLKLGLILKNPLIMGVVQHDRTAEKEVKRRCG